MLKEKKGDGGWKTLLDRWYGTIHLCCSPSYNETAKEQEKSFEKYEKQRQESNNCLFFINHIHYSTCLLLYTTVCLGMQIQGRKLHNQDIAEERSLQQL